MNDTKWTAESVVMWMQGSQHNTPYGDIAKQHNEELDAEKRLLKLAEFALSDRDKQLDASIEHAKVGTAIIKDLRTELADERKKAKELHTIIGQQRDTIKELNEQPQKLMNEALAAERNNVDILVDALTQLRDHPALKNEPMVIGFVKDAIAKVTP